MTPTQQRTLLAIAHNGTAHLGDLTIVRPTVTTVRSNHVASLLTRGWATCDQHGIVRLTAQGERLVAELNERGRPLTPADYIRSHTGREDYR